MLESVTIKGVFARSRSGIDENRMPVVKYSGKDGERRSFVKPISTIVRGGLLALLLLATAAVADEKNTSPQPLIGYTEFRTDLPGGRHANVATMRAVVAAMDGTGRRVLAEELTREPDTWTQFAGWSPDGKLAIIGRGWESPENGRWEEEHKTFRYNAEGWLYDMYLLDLATGKAAEPHRRRPRQLSQHRPVLLAERPDEARLPGAHRRRLAPVPHGPRRHEQARLDQGLERVRLWLQRLARRPADRLPQELQGLRRRCRRLERSRDPDGPAVQLRSSWSSDGKHLLFVAGEHYNCHPYIVAADGTGLRKLADRAGYRGVIEFLDVPDFHGGSSDIPAWSADGKSVFYTAKVGPSVELFRVSLDGQSERLTRTAEGSLHYHPTPSPDGRWLAYGSKREWHPTALHHEPGGPLRAPAHRAGQGPRRHVAALAAAADVSRQVVDPIRTVDVDSACLAVDYGSFGDGVVSGSRSLRRRRTSHARVTGRRRSPREKACRSPRSTESTAMPSAAVVQRRAAIPMRRRHWSSTATTPG